MTRGAHEADLDRRVNELRDRLRSLGYLRNPLETFVTGGAGRGPSFRALGGIACRLGLVGGLLVALLIWLAAVTVNPSLVSSPRDLALLGAYLFAIYVVSVAGVSLAVGAIVLFAARDPRTRARLGPLPPAIGALATLLTFLYGTAWWRAVLFAPDAGPLASRVSLVAGLLLVLLSLLLGRLARVSTALLVETAPGQRAAAARRKRREIVRSVTVGVLASGLFLAYLLATGRSGAAGARAAAPFEVAPPSEACLVIGIDGLSWDEIHHLGARGDLPHLAGLVGRGVRAPIDVSAGGPPPEIWTTIATGESALRHGVRSFVRSRFVGMRSTLAMDSRRSALASALETVVPTLGLARDVPLSGLTRTRKAFWEVVSEKGVATAVVNWWATWPAGGVPGTVVSERAFARLTGTGGNDVDLASDVAPAELVPLAAALADSAVLAVAGRPDRSGRDALGDAAAVRLARAGDLFSLAIAERLVPAIRTGGLLAVYLPGLDIIARPLATAGGENLVAIDEHLEEIHAHARDLDAAVGRLVAAFGERGCVAVVCTPGGTEAGVRSRAPGLFCLAGPGVLGARTARKILPSEIAPTLLVYLGFPASREMAGSPRTDLFTEEHLAARPLRLVESFGARRPPEAGAPVEDEEFLERLRSLGYIR